MIVWAIYLIAVLVLAWIVLFTARWLVFLVAALARPTHAEQGDFPLLRFLVLIPAHNEERFLANTLESLKKVDYPETHFRVMVLADNCTDRTAEVARSLEATVLERDEPENPGKGQAIAWALSGISLDPYDAVSIIDSDSVVSENYLKVMARHLYRGAGAVQPCHGISNPDENAFTGLFAITNTMKNKLHLRGKAVCGLGVPFLNGYALSTSLLKEVGWSAFGITEDTEYALQLAWRGIFVDFAVEAEVSSVKATNFSEAYGQRLRWSAGQVEDTRRLALPLLGRALRQGSLRMLDSALEVISPSYSVMSAVTAAAIVALLVVHALTGMEPILPLAVAAAILLGLQAAFFAAGVIRNGLTVNSLVSLALIPVFVVWRAAIAAAGLAGAGRKSWKRADRGDR